MASDTVNLKEEVKEQRMRQIAGQLELEEFDEINDTHQGILTCQSYLAEERPEVFILMILYHMMLIGTAMSCCCVGDEF